MIRERQRGLVTRDPCTGIKYPQHQAWTWRTPDISSFRLIRFHTSRVDRKWGRKAGISRYPGYQRTALLSMFEHKPNPISCVPETYTGIGTKTRPITATFNRYIYIYKNQLLRAVGFGGKDYPETTAGVWVWVIRFPDGVGNCLQAETITTTNNKSILPLSWNHHESSERDGCPGSLS